MIITGKDMQLKMCIIPETYIIMTPEMKMIELWCDTDRKVKILRKWLKIGQIDYFLYSKNTYIIPVTYIIMMPEMKMIRLMVIELWWDTDRND